MKNENQQKLGRFPTWREKKEFPLTGENLKLLLDDQIPAIRIKGFASPEECQAVVKAMETANVKYYKASTDRKIGYIGMAQVEFRWGASKQDYFDAVPSAYEDRDYVFQRSFDPVQRLIDMLAQVWDAPVGIAEEEGFGRYYAGILRFASGGIALHSDYAPFNSPGYSIGNIDSQLGWNLFVEAPESGGVTTIHHAPWTPEMKGDEPPQSYGLPYEIVDGAETFQYAPSAGDVVLFNSRNPHEISPADGAATRPRLQVGSFVGRMPDRSLVFWA